MDKQVAAELLLEAQNGNNNAFEELISAYENIIKNRIRMNVNNEQVLNELYQNTLTKVYNSLSKCQASKGGFFPFFCKTSEFVIKSYYSTKKKEDINQEVLNEIGQYIYGKNKEYRKTYEEEDSKKIVNGFIKTLEYYNEIDMVECSPEDTFIKKYTKEKTIYENCFEILSKLKNPHKTLIFLLNKVIYCGKHDNKNGNPIEIVNNFSDVKLYDILEYIQLEYEKTSKLPQSILEYNFHNLKELLNEIEEGKAIGDKLLKEYYNKTPSKDISEWSYRVSEQLKKRLSLNLLKTITRS